MDTKKASNKKTPKTPNKNEKMYEKKWGFPGENVTVRIFDDPVYMPKPKAIRYKTVEQVGSSTASVINCYFEDRNELMIRLSHLKNSKITHKVYRLEESEIEISISERML